jgi:hypothetical protein
MRLAEALDDPNLFAHHFQRKSWRAWKSFLAALFAERPSADDLEIYRACTGRASWPLAPSTESTLIVGRRGGKSRILALIAAYLAALKDYGPYLAAGEVATIAVLAADKSQARSIFRFIIGFLKASPLLDQLIVRRDAETIELSNRVVIEITTASFRSTRGYSYGAILCDEVAFWHSDEASSNPDVEILRALRPGLASIPGSMLLIASSPYGKKGEVYNTFRKHYGRDGARVLVWKAPSRVMNSSLDPAIVEEAYESDPEAAKAEYGAEFREDLADFLTQEAIDAVVMIDCDQLPPVPGVVYFAFLDPSGGSGDSMALAIGHLDGDICILDAALEVRAPFNPDDATSQCVALMRRYGVNVVTSDRWATGWVAQRFKEHGIEVAYSDRPKNEIYLDFLPLLNARRVRLLDIKRLSAQFVGLERRTARSGKDSVDHVRGGHDDVANAVAGVLTLVDLDRRPVLVDLKSVTGGGDRNGKAPEPRWLQYAYLVVFDAGADIACVFCGSVRDDYVSAPGMPIRLKAARD